MRAVHKCVVRVGVPSTGCGGGDGGGGCGADKALTDDVFFHTAATVHPIRVAEH